MQKCDAMEGLIKETESIMSETEDGTITRDIRIIAAGQKVEHYEIASYGTLHTITNVLGFTETMGFPLLSHATVTTALT